MVFVVAALLSCVGAPGHAQLSGGGSKALPQTETMDATALYKRAVEYIQARDFTRGAAMLREVLARREGDPASNYMMGIAQIGLHDLGEARRYLSRAVSEKPDLAEALGRLGWVEAKLGNAAGTRKQRDVLADLKAKCAGGCAEAGAIDGAISVIDGILAKPPLSAAGLFNQGIDFLDANRYADAVTAFGGVLAQKPDDFEAAYLKGQAQIGLGDYLGAKASLEDALKLQPGLVNAKGRLGWIEKKLGNTEAAAAIRAGLLASQETCAAASCGGAGQIGDAITMIDEAS
jgi:tetratricopeptide (TPR) repeat protein